MSGLLVIKRARTVPVDTRLFRQIARLLLGELLTLEKFELGVHLVRAPEMTRINETFLQHEGATDVITFDYADHASRLTPHTLHGELFICHDVAVSQAREFRTSWPSELVRYLVHGVLHLQGFDDHRPADRRKMKREENRLLRTLGRRCVISQLAVCGVRRPRLT